VKYEKTKNTLRQGIQREAVRLSFKRKNVSELAQELDVEHRCHTGGEKSSKRRAL